MSWTPPPAYASYYSHESPSSAHSLFQQLSATPPQDPKTSQPDPTWGRSALPRAPWELEVREKYGARDGRVHVGEGQWVEYQIWGTGDGKGGKEADLVWCHGINDYGGKFAVHAPLFLDAGYRIIVPDLPSHGRSTGIHVHIPEMEALADAVYAVTRDVCLQDSKLVAEREGGEVHVTQTRKVFVAGQSLGGFTAVYTCLKYGTPPTTSLPPSSGHSSSTLFHPTLSGGIFLCPMLAISPESRPWKLVETVARGLSWFAGVVPFAEANKGKNSEDGEVEREFEADPQTYHGKLRIATGLAILQGLMDVNAKMEHLTVPFLLCHGTGDRVTSPSGSQLLYDRASSTDKGIKLYGGYEHILLRKGKDEQDDERRQRVLGDVKAWLEAR
ncbi:hypothetical protein JCM11641_007350 [Rhodosporidiobolus odoratus]